MTTWLSKKIFRILSIIYGVHFMICFSELCGNYSRNTPLKDIIILLWPCCAAYFVALVATYMDTYRSASNPTLPITLLLLVLTSGRMGNENNVIGAWCIRKADQSFTKAILYILTGIAYIPFALLTPIMVMIGPLHEEATVIHIGYMTTYILTKLWRSMYYTESEIIYHYHIALFIVDLSYILICIHSIQLNSIPSEAKKAWKSWNWFIGTEILLSLFTPSIHKNLYHTITGSMTVDLSIEIIVIIFVAFNGMISGTILQNMHMMTSSEYGPYYDFVIKNNMNNKHEMLLRFYCLYQIYNYKPSEKCQWQYCFMKLDLENKIKYLNNLMMEPRLFIGIEDSEWIYAMLSVLSHLMPIISVIYFNMDLLQRFDNLYHVIFIWIMFAAYVFYLIVATYFLIIIDSVPIDSFLYILVRNLYYIFYSNSDTTKTAHCINEMNHLYDMLQIVEVVMDNMQNDIALIVLSYMTDEIT